MIVFLEVGEKGRGEFSFRLGQYGRPAGYRSDWPHLAVARGTVHRPGAGQSPSGPPCPSGIDHFAENAQRSSPPASGLPPPPDG